MARNRRNIRGRKKTSTGRIYVAVIMAFIIAVLSYNIVRVYNKDQELKERQDSLVSQVDDAQDKSQELKEYEEYVDSDEYAEQQAREKLGLSYENETIFRESND